MTKTTETPIIEVLDYSFDHGRVDLTVWNGSKQEITRDYLDVLTAFESLGIGPELGRRYYDPKTEEYAVEVIRHAPTFDDYYNEVVEMGFVEDVAKEWGPDFILEIAQFFLSENQ